MSVSQEYRAPEALQDILYRNGTREIGDCQAVYQVLLE